ncbi:MAG: hypothetical protein ABWX65_01185 [Mycetocola sp.]
MNGDTRAGRILDRLPQDVATGSDAGRELELPDFAGSVDDYARAHDQALSDGNHHARARACWGLVARGVDSLTWAQHELASQNDERIEDAAGVLSWIGVPAALVPELRVVVDSLPDGQAADAVAAALQSAVGPDPSAAQTPASEELFDGSLAAFTGTIWFVDALFDTVVDETTAWVAELGGRTSTQVDGPLPTMLEALEPWAMPSWKQLLVQTGSNWTAIFSQGGDIGTHDVVGRRLQCRSLRTSYSPHAVRDGSAVSFGDCAFWLRNADDSTRSIQASFQSRWRWDLHGEPLEFEDQSAYEAKRIPERFTLARMNSYCRTLGIRRDEPDFYLPRGCLIEQDISGWAPPRTLSSREWWALNR